MQIATFRPALPVIRSLASSKPLEESVVDAYQKDPRWLGGLAGAAVGAATGYLVGGSLGLSAGLGAVLGVAAGQVARWYQIPSTVYHFTSREKAQQILRDGVIQANPGNEGPGVYVTRFPSAEVAALQRAAATEVAISFAAAGLPIESTWVPRDLSASRAAWRLSKPCFKPNQTVLWSGAWAYQISGST